MITCYFQGLKKPVDLRHAVVDMLLVRKNQILLVKRGSLYLHPNKWALPGGYLDKNETVKQAALRELEEETGYQCKLGPLFTVIDSLKRRDKNRQNISFVFVLSPVKRQPFKPNKEVTEVKWFDLNQLPQPKDIAFDHLKIIRLYQQYLKKPQPLPLF